MRIIAGLHRGRRLKPVKGDKIRPTTDRVREAIFSILSDRVIDAAVLDLFAGSGALGIEALSRGAELAVFVDKDFDAVSLIKANLNLLDETSRSTVIKGDVLRVCERLGKQSKRFNIIFADPPYKSDIHENVISTILDNELLAAQGIIVYETRPDYQFDDSSLGRFREAKIRTYGDTKVWFLAK